MYAVGVAETPLGKLSGHTELSMVALAAREAQAEAGMTLKDVTASWSITSPRRGPSRLPIT